MIIQQQGSILRTDRLYSTVTLQTPPPATPKLSAQMLKWHVSHKRFCIRIKSGKTKVQDCGCWPDYVILAASSMVVLAPVTLSDDSSDCQY